MTDEPSDIVFAIYGIVSGSSEQPRDWDTVRRLLAPTASLRSIRVDDETTHIRELGRDAWIDAATERFAMGDFHEFGIVRQAIVDGDIATVVSPFAASRSLGGPLFEVGVNHFAFANIDGCWRVVQILWAVWPCEHPMARPILAELAAGRPA